MTRFSMTAALAAATLILAACQPPAGQASQADPTKPETEEDQLFYFIGVLNGRPMKELELTEQQLLMVLAGTRDEVRGETIELDEAALGRRLGELGEQRRQAAVAEERSGAEAYLAQMAAEEGAVTTDTGLIFKSLQQGEGASPAGDSVVRAHYHGTLRDGTVFDSSVNRGQPLEIPLNRVIPCWQEGIAMMKVGGKARLTCPPSIAYGDRGAGSIPGGAALTFEVELLGIVEKE